MFQLQTMGGAQLRDASGAVLLGPGKSVAVVIALALAPGRRATRETLLDLLWSDVPPASARGSLRQTVFQLRRLLGDEALVGTEELTLAAPIAVDRDAFLAALDAEAFGEALAAYHGPFLSTFGVPGGRYFEQWAERERERLEEGFVRAADLHIRRLLNTAQVAEARHVVRRVRDLVPQREATARLVMEVALSAGDLLTASMEAGAVEQAAQRDGLPLEPSTSALLERVRNSGQQAEPESTVAADDEPTLSPELTGREAEFATMTAAWPKVRRGPARFFHLSARAGLGKSRLLRDVLTRLSALDARIASVRGRFGDRDVAYGLLSDLAGAIAELPGALGIAPASAAALVSLNPALSRRYSIAADSASDAESLRRRVLALADLIHAVADEQRFVLAIDDLHWADSLSLQALEALFPRLADAHVLVLVAARPEREPLGASDVLTLAPLSVEHVGSLIESLAEVGATDVPAVWTRAAVEQLHEATGGSPLVILETLRLALDARVLSLDARGWRVLDPARFQQVLAGGGALRARVLALPDDARWLLCLLATAGTPLDRRMLVEAARVDPTKLSASFDTLERLGFAMRVSGGWVPVHDEMADAARDTYDVAAQRRAEGDIARAYATVASDLSGLRRAARHGLAAKDDEAQATMVRRVVHESRWRGDRRPLRELVADLFAIAPNDPRLPRLLQAVPPLWRLGLWSPWRQVIAMVAVIGLMVGGFTAWQARAARRAREQQLFYVSSTMDVSRLRIDASRWSRTAQLTPEPIRTDETLRQLAQEVSVHPELLVHVSPDRRSFAWTHDSGDSTTLDIWLRTPSGVRRLTHEARDDVMNGWLPDGSALVGSTNRWSPRERGHYNLALFDTATGAARPLTHGPFHENTARVSPDGTRIAFVREGWTDTPAVCVTDVDGATEPECRVVSEYTSTIVGWSGVDELILIGQSSTDRPMLAYDWTRRSLRRLLGPSVSEGIISPDGQFVVASVRGNGTASVRDWIVPVDRPADAHPVEQLGERTTDWRWWDGPRDRSVLITRLVFADSTRMLPLGVSTQLRVIPLNADGREVRTPARVRWTSSDTAVAVINDRGEVVPRRPGVTTIEASLAGWRTVRDRFEVRGALHHAVLEERWGDDWTTRWFDWGDPKPIVMTGPSGIRALWNRGDGTYVSAAVSRRDWSVEDGLGLEVRLATPFSSFDNQRIRVLFVGGLDSLRIATADQQAAFPTISRLSAICGALFPDPGEWGKRRMAFNGPGTLDVDLAATADLLRSGQWWTLRVQILTDGRCGVAVNGRVVHLSAEPVARHLRYRIRLGDEAQGARLLHGPVEVWTGVRTDVVWQTPGPARP